MKIVRQITVNVGRKEDCIANLKVFYGIDNENHVSRSSGIFYTWVVQRFGEKLVLECEKELGVNAYDR